MDTLREEPQGGTRVRRDNDGEYDARNEQLLLPTAQGRSAYCCCPKQLCRGSDRVGVSERAVNAEGACLDQAGHCQCKVAELRPQHLRQRCASVFSSCLVETYPCEHGLPCNICSRCARAGLCDGRACRESLCSACCGPLPRCAGLAEWDIRNTSWAGSCRRDAQLCASLELLSSVQQLDIVQSLCLLTYRGANPFFPVQCPSRGILPRTVRGCSAGGPCCHVVSDPRTNSTGKCEPGSFFCASLAIRAAQRIANVLHSPPLQLLQRSLQSSSEYVNSSSADPATETQHQQHKLAQTFPPEPCEGDDIFLMRCILTWGAAASHQLGYEVFSSAVEKLYQPPRCVALRAPEPLNSSARNNDCLQASGTRAGSALAVPSEAHVQMRKVPFADESSTTMTGEGDSPSCSQNRASASTNNGRIASSNLNHCTGPNISHWSRGSSSSGGLAEKLKSEASSLQVQFVKCGPSTSVAVTYDGNVWVWGKNADGRRRMYATPVILEGLEIGYDGDRWQESVRSVKRTARGAENWTEGANDAIRTAEAVEAPAGVVGAAGELSRETEGGSSRRASDARPCPSAVYERTRRGVVLQVIDAAVGAQHCLLLVDVLRGDDTRFQPCGVKVADRSSSPTDSHPSVAQQEQGGGRRGNASSRRTRIRRARRIRLDGGTLFPSELSERLSFSELVTTDEEENEGGESPKADAASESFTVASAPTAARGDPEAPSPVTERRLYVWGSNGCHQLGFSHCLSEAARYRVDIVSSPHVSSVKPCAATSSSPSFAEYSWNILPQTTSPATEGSDAVGATDPAKSDRGSSAAALSRAEDDAPVSTTGLRTATSAAKALKRAPAGQRKQAELNTLASYTPLILARSTSVKSRSSSTGLILSTTNNSTYREDSDRRKCSGGRGPACATGCNVCGRDAATVTRATGALRKGIQLQLHVQAVAAGWTHSLLLLQDGRVLVFGDNSYGQCAQQPSVASVSSPTPVAQLPPCCAIVAGQRTSAAITVPPQSIFVWGGCPVSRSALLAESASSAAAGVGSAAQQRVVLRRKQNCPSSSTARSRPCVVDAATALAAAGGTSASADVADRHKKDVFLASSCPRACTGGGALSRTGSGGGFPHSLSSSASCSALSRGTPASYLAYFTPLRLKGSRMQHASGFFEGKGAADSVSSGCAATGHESEAVAATLDDENGWRVQPAARHCPVLRPESVAVSDSLGIAVGVDERLYVWRCRGQRPCVIRPVIAHLHPLSSSTVSAADVPACASCSSPYSTSCCATCYCCDASRCVAVRGWSFSSASPSTAVSRAWRSLSTPCASSFSPPPSSSLCSSKTLSVQPSTKPPLFFTKDSNLSSRRDATATAGRTAAAVVDAARSTALSAGETVAARGASPGRPPSSCRCAAAAVPKRRDTLLLQPPCRIRQLVITSTHIYLLTHDGLLFTATPPSDAAEPSAISGATTSAADSLSPPVCCRTLLQPPLEGQNGQQQGMPQPQRLQDKQQEQSQKLLQQSHPQQQTQEFSPKDYTLERCLSRDSESGYFSLCFHPIPGLASVQQISCSDTHAAAVVALYSPSFPPFSRRPPKTSCSCLSSLGACGNGLPADSCLLTAAGNDVFTAAFSQAVRRARVCAPCCDLSRCPPTAAARSRQLDLRSTEAGAESVQAAAPAAAVRTSATHSVSSYGNPPPADDTSMRRLPRVTTSFSAVRAPDTMSHRADTSFPRGVPTTAAVDAFPVQPLPLGADARYACDFPAGGSAVVPARSPTHAASDARLRAGFIKLPSADLFTEATGYPPDHRPAAGGPTVVALAGTSGGVTACRVAAPVCATNTPSVVAGTPGTFSGAVHSETARPYSPASRTCSPARISGRYDFPPPTGAEAGKVVSMMPPSLGAYAARALLRTKSPLPPSVSFLLYTIAPAALCVRDKPLFEFCCLYLLFNLPFLFAGLSSATLPSPLPAAFLVAESKADAKQVAGGSTVCCCCSSYPWRGSSSSVTLSSRSTSDTNNNTDSTSSSGATNATDNSSGRMNHSDTCTVGGDVVGQLELIEDDRHNLHHVPAAAGMQYLLRGLAELLPLPCLLKGGGCRDADAPWQHCRCCCCCSAQATMQQQAELNAVDGCCAASAAATRKRHPSQRHRNASSCSAALSVGKEDIRFPLETMDVAGAVTAHAAASASSCMPPRSLSPAATERQRGWWEEDGCEDNVADSRGGRAGSTTEYRGDRMHSGDRREAVARRMWLLQSRNTGAPARRNAGEGWVAEEANLMRSLRTAAVGFLCSYVPLHVCSKCVMTEQSDRNARWLRGSFPACAKVSPFHEYPQPRQQAGEALQRHSQQMKQLREFCSALLAADGAADPLVEKLKRQPLLYLLQRRASVLMERCRSSTHELSIGRGLLEQAARSSCSCHHTERHLLMQCWPNVLWSPVCRGAPPRNITEAAVEGLANLKAKAKPRSEEKTALKPGKAKNASKLDRSETSKERRTTEQSQLEGNTCQVGTVKESSDIAKLVVDGTEGEGGVTSTARTKPVARLALGTAVAEAATRSVRARLSGAEREASARTGAEPGGDSHAFRDPLLGRSAQTVSRGDTGARDASRDHPRVAALTTITNGSPAGFPSLVASTGQSHSTLGTFGTLRQSCPAESSGDAAAPPFARERVPSVASACDVSSAAATCAATAAVEAAEISGQARTSLPSAAVSARGSCVWGRENKGREATGDEAASPAATVPPTTKSTSHATFAAPVAADQTTENEAFLEAGDKFQDWRSPVSAGEAYCEAAWQQVWSKKKQRTKDTRACSNAAERGTASLTSRRSSAAGDTLLVVNPDATRAVHAATGGGRTLTVAAESAGTLGGRGAGAAGVGNSARENGDRDVRRHLSSAENTCRSTDLRAVPDASARACESDAAMVSGNAGTPAATAVAAHQPRRLRRCTVMLKDFLVLPPQSKERKHKAEKEARGKDTESSHVGGTSAATTVLSQEAGQRRWGQGRMAEGTEGEMKSSNSTGNNSSNSTTGSRSAQGNSCTSARSGMTNPSNHSSSASSSDGSSSSATTSGCASKRNTMSSSNSGNCGNSCSDIGSRSAESLSGTRGSESTEKPQMNMETRGEEGVSSKPQSLAEIMREEEELQRRKQLRRQWQLQQELQHSAAAATRGTEQPIVVLRFRGCSQGVTAFAAWKKEHRGQGGKLKPANRAAPVGLQPAATANYDACGSSASPCHPRGNDGIMNTRSFRSSGGRDISSSAACTGSGATSNISNSNRSRESTSKKTYGRKQSSSIADEASLDVVANCSVWRIAPAPTRSSPLRCDASINCWGLEAALRARGEGAVDLLEVQQQELKEQLAQQQQRDDEADLQEALWLISEMEERENKEAARQREEEADLQEALWLISKMEESENKEAACLELETKGAGGATPDAACEAPSTLGAATLAGGAAGGRTGVAAEPLPLASVVFNTGTTSYALSPARAEKWQPARVTETYHIKLTTSGVHDAREHQCAMLQQRDDQGQRHWQYGTQAQYQGGCRREKVLLHDTCAHQQRCQQKSATSSINDIRSQQPTHPRRQWQPVEQQRHLRDAPSTQRQSHAQQQLRSLQQREHAQLQTSKQEHVQREVVRQEYV